MENTKYTRQARQKVCIRNVGEITFVPLSLCFWNESQLPVYFFVTFIFSAKVSWLFDFDVCLHIDSRRYFSQLIGEYGAWSSLGLIEEKLV